MKSHDFHQSRQNQGIRTNRPTDQVNWSTGRNVSLLPGGIVKDLGKELLAVVGYPVKAIFTFKGHDGVVRTIVCTDTVIYSYTNDFGSVQDITPASYGGVEETGTRWQFEVIAGVVTISNGSYYGIWTWEDYNGVLIRRLYDATDGEYGYINVLGKSMNRLLLGDYTVNGGAWAARVRWSDIGKPLSMGEGVTGTNGFKDLSDPMESEEASETVLHYSNIGRRTLVFTNQNIWFLDPVNDVDDYTAHIGVPGIGLAGPDLVTKTEKKTVFLMGKEDFYKISGGNAIPIGFDIRNSCFPNLNKAALASGFAYYKPSTREVYFCVATASNTSPDTAFVYQTETEEWSIKDVDYTCFTHAYDNQAYTWDENPYGDWTDPSDSEYDDMTKNGVIPYGVVGSSTGYLYKTDTGNNNVSAAIYGYIETGDMVFGNRLQDTHVEEVWPILKPQTGQRPLLIQVGTRESLHHDIQWSEPEQVSIGSGDKADFRDVGKYVRFRFFTNSLDAPFFFEGFTVVYFLGGTGR